MRNFWPKRTISLVPGRRLSFPAGLSGLFLALAPVVAPGAAHGAEQPQLALPIRCELGRDCWLVNRVDMDPGPGVRDYACKGRTYDGHKGTDIAIRDLEVMNKGVAVLASAAGIVRGGRDGMADVDFTKKGGPKIESRECGNGVVLAHGDGWETQYCHMRRGSVMVRLGDKVEKGQQLGLVGHSGRAQFPHVHLSVRLKQKVIDPFAGLGRTENCRPGPKPLWEPETLARLGQDTTAVFHVGFASGAPKPDAARAGRLNGKTMPAIAPALVLWADIYWVNEGDELIISITAPNGTVLTRRAQSIKKTQARYFGFAGKKRKLQRWPEGVYRGEIVLRRVSGTAKKMEIKVTRDIEIR